MEFRKQSNREDETEVIMPSFCLLSPEVYKNLFAQLDVQDEDKQTQSGNKELREKQKRKSSIVILEGEEIDDFERKQVAKNTTKLTDSAVRRLSSWYLERYGKQIKLSEINKDKAADLLKHFFLEIRDTRKETAGEEYEPATLTAYRNGLRRYFLERQDGETFDIGDDPDLQKKLSAKRKQLKAAGKGSRPYKADPLDENQIEKLWSNEAIGTKTPRQLLQLVWWNNIRMLGMRGRQEQLNCHVSDFHDHGSYFEYVERSTKTRAGDNDGHKARRKYNNKIFRGDGSDRDPYLALKKYISHRPAGVKEFYLQPIDSPRNEVWCKRLPLKRDGLGNIMKRMAKQAEIDNEGHFTNTSGRKTAVQSLRGYFDPVGISELSGHANPSSIQSYSHNSLGTQRDICQRLAGCSSTTLQNNTTTSVNVSNDGNRQVLSSIFNSTTLTSCQININFQK